MTGRSTETAPVHVPDTTSGAVALGSTSEHTTQYNLRSLKRARPTSDDEPRVVKKTKQAASQIANEPQAQPPGLKWDDMNWSCAYDALFTAVYHTWLSDARHVSQFMRNASLPASMLLDGFIRYGRREITLESARDAVRAVIHDSNPRQFPYGTIGCSVVLLAEVMFDSANTPWIFTLKCRSCNKTTQAFTAPARLLDVPNVELCDKELRASLLHSIRRTRCCGEHTYSYRDVTIMTGPDMAFFSIADSRGGNGMPMSIGTGDAQWKLTSLVYYGNYHFVTRHINHLGNIWFHDGMRLNGSGTFDGRVDAIDPKSLAFRANGPNPSNELTLISYKRIHRL